MKEELRKEIELGTGITANLDKSILKKKGHKGEVKKNFLHPKVTISLENNKIILYAAESDQTRKDHGGFFQVAHKKHDPRRERAVSI